MIAKLIIIDVSSSFLVYLKGEHNKTTITVYNLYMSLIHGVTNGYMMVVDVDRELHSLLAAV